MLVFALVFAAAPAHASPRHIKGVCGLHRGAREIPYLHRYHVRVGPRNGTSGGSHHCRGVYHRKQGRNLFGATTPNGLPFWSPFDFQKWNWHGIVDVTIATGFTAASCATFAAAFAGEFPTGGLDTIGTAAAGAACVGGAQVIKNTVNTDFYPRR